MRQAPESHAEKRALHEKLLQFAAFSTKDGTTKGLAKLIGSFEDEGFRAHLICWLEMFTPIRWRRQPNGQLDSYTPNWEGYDLGGAKLNPYYTFTSVDGSSRKNELSHKAGASGNVQLSAKEFERKIIRLSLEKYLRDSTIENRKSLIDLISRYESAGGVQGGNPFLQGGAPGLGRRS